MQQVSKLIKRWSHSRSIRIVKVLDSKLSHQFFPRITKAEFYRFSVNIYLSLLLFSLNCSLTIRWIVSVSHFHFYFFFFFRYVTIFFFLLIYYYFSSAFGAIIFAPVAHLYSSLLLHSLAFSLYQNSSGLGGREAAWRGEYVGKIGVIKEEEGKSDSGRWAEIKAKGWRRRRRSRYREITE